MTRSGCDDEADGVDGVWLGGAWLGVRMGEAGGEAAGPGSYGWLQGMRGRCLECWSVV